MPINTKSRARSKRMTSYKNLLTSTKGQPPQNPFKALRETGKFELSNNTVSFNGMDIPGRIQVRLDMTMQEIADNAGLTKQALLRTEQGFYQSPPERLTDWFVRKFDVPYATLIEGYEQYQRDTRKYHGLLFGIFPNDEYPFNINEHPFETLKSHWSDPTGTVLFGTLNTTEVAKLLCLSQSVLGYWETRVKQQASVPSAFNEALLHNGYTRTDLFYLKYAYTQYRNKILGHDYVSTEDGLVYPPVGSTVGKVSPVLTAVENLPDNTKSRILELVREQSNG